MRGFAAFPFLLLAGCVLPYEARTAYSRSMDDDGRHARNVVTTELRWPLWGSPAASAANYVELPQTEQPPRTHFYAQPPCSTKR